MASQVQAGVYGDDATWGFLAYGAGDVDNTVLNDKADTWSISSMDGILESECPAQSQVRVASGEPFNIYNDVNCD
jgi:type IV pilus assembly protein PilA